MIYTFHIKDSSSPEVKAFIEYIKTLDFVSIEEKIEYPNLTDKEIIDRVEETNVQIKKGKTTSHDKLRKDSQSW